MFAGQLYLTNQGKIITYLVQPGYTARKMPEGRVTLLVLTDRTNNNAAVMPGEMARHYHRSCAGDRIVI